MMAVVACFAAGTTTLANVAHARIKETDRITVMREELGRLGARITEQEDGLVIDHSELRGTEVDGRHDHRVVMALAIAGCAIPGETVIRTADAATVTFPAFAERVRDLGGQVQVVE